MPPNYQFDGNLTDPALVFAEASGQVPILGPMILLFLFVVITSAGYFYQDRKVGKGNIFMWMTISGLIISVASMFLFLIPGIINLETLVITVSLTFVFTLLFFLTGKDRGTI